ncbi:MAG: YggS family pyridoxal phosphate-dependent enzyme [Dermatophilaceae bacterium]
MSTAERRQQLAGRLATVRRRVEAACEQAQRDPQTITLVVVTKFFPASDAVLLAELGVTDVGENRDQEARAKYADVRARGVDLTVHFIGQLQSNKARSVAGYADVVHTVDRPKLVAALERGAAACRRRLRVLVQVCLDDSSEPSAARPELHRGGVPPADALELADLVAATAQLQLAGVMAVAPMDADPDTAFARLADVAHGIRERHPGASWVSAGMSGDLEAAIRHGATHLRVGTAILGSRPPLR